MPTSEILYRVGIWYLNLIIIYLCIRSVLSAINSLPSSTAQSNKQSIATQKKQCKNFPIEEVFMNILYITYMLSEASLSATELDKSVTTKYNILGSYRWILIGT